MLTSKRISALVLTLCMILTAFCLPASASDKNMFKNGDFSQGLSGWQTWTQNPRAATFSIVPDGGPDGSRCLKIESTGEVACSAFQFIDCRQGGSYMMTCDIKYENVSTSGRGACLGLATYDKDNVNIGELASEGATGTSDGWKTVNFIFDITNNPERVNGGPRLWFSTGTVYVDNVTLTEISLSAAKAGAYDLTLSDTPNRHAVDALGCEWDPKMLLDVNERRGVIEADLSVIRAAMEEMGLQAVRMMITPDWFEYENDNDDPNIADPAGFHFDNDEMRSVFAYLKVCEELGIRVNLTWWGAPSAHFLAFKGVNDWITAPNDLDEMAENISYLLSYIRNTLGYSCVKGLILQNEPSYSFKVGDGSVDFDYYVEYYKTVRARLDADGMGDIVMIGADDAQHLGWFTQSYNALKDVCGKFNSHNYAWSYNTPHLDSLIQEYVSNRTDMAGDIPFFLGEFGDGSTEGAYKAGSTKTYERGIYVASVVVNALKAGAAGMSYWPLHDIYYYEGDPMGADNGGLMSMGLIGYKVNGAWTYRPTYYAYGLLCNAIPLGSTVYNVEGFTDHYVDTVAVKTPEGRFSIISVNRSPVDQTVNIKAPAIGTSLKVYTFSKYGLPADQSMIPSDGTLAPVNGTYSMGIPAESFVVLSSIGMTEAELTAENALPFTDVYPSDRFYGAIKNAYETGLFRGTSDTEFSPNVTMTRSMFVTVLGRLAGVNTADYDDTPAFTDVKAGEWYTPYVAWANDKGIALGYDTGAFGVTDEINVEQAAVILARYAKFTGRDVTASGDASAFRDAGEVSAWALSDLLWTVENEIYIPDGALLPKSMASRALVAGMMYHMAGNRADLPYVIPRDLPLPAVDTVLFEQTFDNMENDADFTVPGGDDWSWASFVDTGRGNGLAKVSDGKLYMKGDKVSTVGDGVGIRMWGINWAGPTVETEVDVAFDDGFSATRLYVGYQTGTTSVEGHDSGCTVYIDGKNGRPVLYDRDGRELVALDRSRPHTIRIRTTVGETDFSVYVDGVLVSNDCVFPCPVDVIRGFRVAAVSTEPESYIILDRICVTAKAE